MSARTIRITVRGSFDGLTGRQRACADAERDGGP
ncbi:DUF6204 family protein [Streptomyces sp. H27-S2]|nr:DUF6204 family protein [Streptomyces sp. H27-S2]MCY0949641.1 DUF6204 family protein [Streptomyces sp. H27-S2]